MARKTADDTKRQSWDVDGKDVEVTSLDRVLWPDDELTKGDLLEYVRAIAPVILRYVTGHPVTFNVFPRGISEQGYYRRRMPDNAPDWIESIDYQAESRSDVSRVPVIQRAADLVWFANQGCIEFHMWSSPASDVEHPNWAIFDLDPGEKADFSKVCEAAVTVRDQIREAGLESFAKTSGARGMHIFVPIEPDHDMERVREWVQQIAQQAKDNNKELIETGGAETHRGSKVTVDDAQNSVARNTAAPYTPRALPGATVSAPVTWREIQAGKLRPDDFTMENIQKRLEKKGDIWEQALELKQQLPIE